VPPTPGQLNDETPFTVNDQVRRNHSVGDGFIAQALFTRFGPAAVALGPGGGSSTMVHNNFDEGGHDYEAKPETSGRTYEMPGVPEDNTGGVGYEPPPAAGAAGLRGVALAPAVYLTLTPDSPTLPQQGGSGADILYDPDPFVPGTERVFANSQMLGLDPLDDIDAFVIFDTPPQQGIFDEGDVILFSLADGSPSLNQALFPDLGTNGPGAAIFIAVGQPGAPPQLNLFANARDLGLAGGNDDIDGMEIVPCPDAALCSALGGIRLVKGDWTDDGFFGKSDVEGLANCVTGPREGPLFDPAIDPLCFDVFDCQRDQDVDLADLRQLQIRFDASAP
jgi:hypothetical protein